MERVYQTNDHLSVMSAISTRGQLYSLVRQAPLNSVDTVSFLKHLLHCLSNKMLVIWDGSPIHRGPAVREFLASGAAKRIHLERLPPYAPDLNPAEGIWNQLKYTEMRNLCCRDLGNLHSELSMAFERLRSKRHIINGFFAGAQLPLPKNLT